MYFNTQLQQRIRARHTYAHVHIRTRGALAPEVSRASTLERACVCTANARKKVPAACQSRFDEHHDHKIFIQTCSPPMSLRVHAFLYYIAPWVASRMSHPKVIRPHVPMFMTRLIRRLQIASEAGVAKTIWATLAIKGYLAEFALRQSSTSHDQPSATVRFFHPHLPCNHCFIGWFIIF